MARYKLQQYGVLDTTRNACIPNSADNIDWQEYQAWLAKGNTPDPADPVDYMLLIRSERNNRISSCDWTQLPDVIEYGRLSSEQVIAFREYRQALADMPQNNPNITTKAQYDAIVWPTEPAL